MLTIGLIGGVASGKSAVAAKLARRGAIVFDADQIGHAVLQRPAVRDELVARWGREILDGAGIVACHERAAGKYVEVLSLDHYLEVLKTKPGALPGATALAQAKASGAFTPTHQRFWDAARQARGDAAGTKALIEVLLAHRNLPATALVSAMRRAVEGGTLDPQAVLIDARREAVSHIAPVAAVGALARYDRPAPTLAGYDALLAGSRR